ncbi:MAG: hypothetical protein U0031_11680 [Thermomicrobiales bacterium]
MAISQVAGSTSTTAAWSPLLKVLVPGGFIEDGGLQPGADLQESKKPARKWAMRAHSRMVTALVGAPHVKRAVGAFEVVRRTLQRGRGDARAAADGARRAEHGAAAEDGATTGEGAHPVGADLGHIAVDDLDVVDADVEFVGDLGEGGLEALPVGMDADRD